MPDRSFRSTKLGLALTLCVSACATGEAVNRGLRWIAHGQRRRPGGGGRQRRRGDATNYHRRRPGSNATGLAGSNGTGAAGTSATGAAGSNTDQRRRRGRW